MADENGKNNDKGKGKGEGEDQDAEREPEIQPSTLDDATHRELGLIYDDATRTILYAKGIQWKSVASTLVIYVAGVWLAKFVPADELYFKMLRLGLIFTGMVSVFLLILFQIWQHNEGRKISAIEEKYSSVFRAIRQVKSTREANFHRYIILLFMVGIITLSGILAIITLTELGR
ncbi:MAG: hypothetical protein HQ503_11300 [Rhodospirillales bacterium]|nr:hypothetical protein [Rhodospirillales bacterium]